jgi:hypothetical protein
MTRIIQPADRENTPGEQAVLDDHEAQLIAEHGEDWVELHRDRLQMEWQVIRDMFLPRDEEVLLARSASVRQSLDEDRGTGDDGDYYPQSIEELRDARIQWEIETEQAGKEQPARK